MIVIEASLNKNNKKCSKPSFTVFLSEKYPQKITARRIARNFEIKKVIQE
jgi:hypothetical protein